MELLMEKIRSKANQYKTFAECAKALRMSQLEKRFPMDVNDRNQLQKCLDTLQQSMKVNTLQGMVERLESISRQLNLKLMAGQTGLELFISSDMFYLEISLELPGSVKDVKIHHEGKSEQQSCDELVKSLSRGDFDDFTTQLQGLISIYQLNAEKKVKCKAFSALCALETDLDTQWSLQSNVKDFQTLLYKSPVGILERRKGGHPMRLTYFVSPYDVLEIKKELSLDLIYKNKIGCSVTVCLEGSAAHKLQVAPLITVNKSSGKSSFGYLPMTSANSTTLPAYFVLKLNKPQPVCLELVKHINTIAELECCDTTNACPLFSLITQHFSNGKMDSSLNKGLFVNLPEQVHCYFMTECKGLDGVIVSSIPFTHPSQVPQILAALRQQAVFNALVYSVIRPHSKQDVENMIMLEISALSCRHISVSFEHPLQESMSTIEIDLTDISAVKAKLYSTATEPNLRTSTEHISKILQRCLSIPVTMRYLIRTLQNQQMDINFTSVNNGSFSSAPNGGLGGNSDRGLDTSKIKQEPGISNGLSGRGSTLKNLMNDDFTSFSTAVLDNSIQKSANIITLVTEQHKKKRKIEKHWKNVKQKSIDECEVLLESSSNDSLSASTPMDIDVDQEFLSHEKDNSINCDPDEVDEVLKVSSNSIRGETKIKKSKEVKKSPSRSSLIMDLTDGKSLVPPSVTITPITSNSPNINSVLERRPGIEIIPISNSAPSNLTSSITITPISSSNEKDERKSFKRSNLEDKLREKKRKRKRDEESGSKMGPPGKVPAKNDPLSKPVSVSIIKPAADSPPAMNRPNSPSVRKYSASPTHFRDKPTASSIQPSPKHSPAYGSSPKHSPKHGTTSPKQPSSSTGKPSMSTLKSASSSPNSSKNESKVKSSGGGSGSSKDSRDRETSRKGSGTTSGSSSGSPKIKSSSVKIKQLEINEISATAPGSTILSINSSSIDLKNPGNALQRNRKGSLSAVIDKLKSAQEVGDPVIGGGVGSSSCSSPNISKRDIMGSGTSKESKISLNTSASATSKISLDSRASQIQKIPDGVKNPAEYMVKQSSDGMKLLINKKSKESSKIPKNGSCSGTGSFKTHTGLKPGVLSGPASKKPPSSKSSGISNMSSKISGSISKSSASGMKTSTSLSKSTSKTTGSPKTSTSGATDLSRKENIGKSRTLKSGMEKGIFKEVIRKGSPAPSRDEEHERVIKALKLDSALPPSLVVEGLIKPFDTKFQIPKLSARNNNNNSSSSSHFDSNNMTSLNTDPGENNNNSTTASSSSGSSSSSSASCSTGPNSNSSKNNNNNTIKSSMEKQVEKSDVKIVELPTHKISLDVAANLKYTSKHDSDCMAKVPSTGMPNLLPLPMGLTNVSPKLPMTSPNLPTTSLSSITSKLDRGDDSPGILLNEKLDVELKSSTIDGSSIKFQSASSMKADDLKRSELSKHVMVSSQQSSDILDFSSNVGLPGKLGIMDKSEKSILGSTPPCFIKPHSPALFGKSPGQSPLNLPSHSPQSITDDELMDEALLLRK